MQLDLRAAVTIAQSPTPWEVGNEVLYELCRNHSLHTNIAPVIAKVWLIGRAYAAAIERRRNKSNNNDDFYVDIVGPTIVSSKIDLWIANSKRWDKPSEESLSTLLEAHNHKMQLFDYISGLEKRSLASKYLHFHVPSLFFIYDSRAVEAMRKLGDVVGRADKVVKTPADNEYRKFVVKCLALQKHIESEYGVYLTPRKIDVLLLYVQAENR